MHGERHEPDPHLRVIAFHRLHQANVAFLDQVGERQAIAHIATGDVNHEAQVAKHQLAGSIQIAVIAEPTRQAALLFGIEAWHQIDRTEVILDGA